MVKVVPLLLLFGAAAGAGALVGRPAEEAVRFERLPRVQRSVSPDSPPPPPTTLSVDFEPVGVEHRSRGESLVMEMTVDANLDGAIRGVYAFELVDDLGQPVRGVERSPRFEFRRGQSKTFRLSTPVLPDGFYIARVTVAADNGHHRDGAVRSIELEVRAGHIRPVDDIEFLHSRAKGGVR